MASSLNIRLDKHAPYPVYRQLSEALREQINLGEFKTDEALPEEREMSRQLNISRPTLRKSLQILQDEGYIYKIRGRGVFIADRAIAPTNIYSCGSRRLVGISFFESVEDSHTVVMANGAIEYLRTKGVSVIRMNHFSFKDEREHLRCNHHLLSGLITSIPFCKNDECGRNINYSRSLGLPLAVIGHPELISDEIRVDSVESDDERGIASVIDHLVKRGHQHITFFCSNGLRKLPSPRRNGYRWAMMRAGLHADMVFPERRGSGAAAVINNITENATAWLKSAERKKSAIIAENDMTAIGIHNAMSLLGIKCPEQIELVGYGNDIEAAILFPGGKLPFPTVAVDRGGIGRKAAELLLKRLQKPKAPFETIKVPTRLIGLTDR